MRVKIVLYDDLQAILIVPERILQKQCSNVTVMEITYSFSRSIEGIQIWNLPIAFKTFVGGVVVRYEDGSLRIYDEHPIDSKIEYKILTHISGRNSVKPTKGLEVFSGFSENNDEFYTKIYVGDVDGTIMQYALPSGNLINEGKVTFPPFGLAVDSDSRHLLVWGPACEMVILDQNNLSLVARWSSLPDWPLPTPLFDRRMLIAYKNGDITQWKVWPVSQRRMSLEQLDSSSIVRESVTSVTSHSYAHVGTDNDDDQVIDIKQVGELSWAVARRYSWTLFKWEENSLVEQISARVSQGITELVAWKDMGDGNSASKLLFGVLTRNQDLIWVSDGNVQVLKPCWSSSDVLKCTAFDGCRVYALILGKDSLYIRKTTVVGPTAISWSDKIKLESFNIMHCISGTFGNDMALIAYKLKLTLFTIQGFIKNQATASVKLSSEISALNGTAIKDHILIGTLTGSLILADSSLNVIEELRLFSTPLKSVIKLNATKVIAVSQNSSLAIIHVMDQRFKKNHSPIFVPGRNTEINYLWYHENFITLEYRDGEKRSWDILEGVQLFEIQDLQQIIPLTEEINDGILIEPPIECSFPMMLIRMGKFIDATNNNSLTNAKETAWTIMEQLIDRNRYLSKLSILLPKSYAEHGQCKVGIATPTTRICDVMADGESSACTIALWSALWKTVFGTMPDPDIIRSLISATPATAKEFANLIGADPAIHLSSRICLEEFISTILVDKEQLDRFLNQWKLSLPITSLHSDTTNSAPNDQHFWSVVVLALLFIVSVEGCSGISLPESLARDVAKSLDIYLHTSGVHREKAVELIGRGWVIWQNHINPYRIIDGIIQILIGQNQAMLGHIEEQNAVTKECTICLRLIFDQNPALMVTSLVTYTGTLDNSLESRIMGIRILTKLVSTDRMLRPHHFPNVFSSMLQVFDSGPQNRQVSQTFGTSLVTEVTNFLTKARSSFPNSITLNKTHQKLAVATMEFPAPSNPSKTVLGSDNNSSKVISLVNASPQTQGILLSSGLQSSTSLDSTMSRKGQTNIANSGSPRILLGLVYDLRSGTVTASLTASTKEVPINSMLGHIQFSQDAKFLCGILEFPDGLWYLIAWKIALGFMSMLHNMSLGASTSGTTAPRRISLPGNVSPLITRPIPAAEDGASVSPKLLLPIDVGSEVEWSIKGDIIVKFGERTISYTP